MNRTCSQHVEKPRLNVASRALVLLLCGRWMSSYQYWNRQLLKYKLKSCRCHGVYWFHWDHLDAGTCLSASPFAGLTLAAIFKSTFLIPLITIYHKYLAVCHYDGHVACVTHICICSEHHLMCSYYNRFLLAVEAFDFAMLWWRERCPVVYTLPCACSRDIVHSVSTSMHACFQWDLMPMKTHSSKR